MRKPWLAVGMVACCAVAGCAAQPFVRHVAGPIPLAHVISAGRDTVRQAELDVVSGASAIDVETGDLHGQLYEVVTPKDSNAAPVATVDGDAVRVSLASTSQPGPATMRVVLASTVSWRIRLDGGATEESVNLTNARLAGLVFGAGCSHIDVTLPKPVGTVPVTMSGGASSFELHLPGGVPARVWFAGGAGSATVDGASRAGIAGGTVLDTSNWPTSPNRYVIDNTAGVSALTLDRVT